MRIVTKLVVLAFLGLSLHSGDVKTFNEVEVLKNSKFVDKYTNEKLNWVDAKNYCKIMDARLPKISEFQEMYKIVGKKSKYFAKEWYWSVDETNWRLKNGAYRFSFADGRDDFNVKDAVYNVRCVKIEEEQE